MCAAPRSATPSAWGFAREFVSLAPLERTFPQHYLLYASRGAIRLEVGHVTWLLPPQRAAFIRAGTPIAVASDTPFTSCSVLFDAATFAAPPFDCRVFAMSALAREMTRHAMRWGPDRAADDPEADDFFRALAAVCAELYAHPDAFWLPQARSEPLARVIADLQRRLDEPLTFSEAAALAGLSERTLARRFSDETGMGWRDYLQRARMIRAMERLAGPHPKILAVAQASGFESQSAFIAAFRKFTGETPSAYRARFR